MKTTLPITAAGITLALLAPPGFAASAADNWENHCASCHGEDGKARTRIGKKLRIRDYTDPKVQAELKDDAMLKAVLEGYVDENGKERMKGYKDEISEDEAKALVDFIRNLKP